MLNELLEKYMDSNEMYNLEGVRGVRHLAKIVKVLGYNGQYNVSPNHAFLEDNPGALHALVDWIGEQNCPENSLSSPYK